MHRHRKLHTNENQKKEDTRLVDTLEISEDRLSELASEGPTLSNPNDPCHHVISYWKELARL